MTTSAKKKMTEVINRSFKQTAFRLPVHLILAVDVEEIRDRYKSRDDDILRSRIWGRLSCSQGFEQSHARQGSALVIL